IAAIDPGSGAATAWNPTGNNFVSALAVSGGTVYAGGAFTSIGGQARSRIAAMDARTAAAPAWNPNASHCVNAPAVGGGAVYAGGAFSNLGNLPQSNVAAIGISTTDVSDAAGRGLVTLLYQNMPNPFRSSTLIRFTLARWEAVTLKVYDLAGREVATLLRNE